MPQDSDTCSRNHSFGLAISPINIDQLKTELSFYDHPDSVTLLNGFLNGFPLHYEGPRIHSESKNLKSALAQPDIVLQKIKKEVKCGRVAGPFHHLPIPTLRISPIGLVPKKTPNEHRLIHHLSYPLGSSVNDFIDPKFSSVQYTRFDEAIHLVQDLGTNCLLFKMDIKSAFRLLPVSPSDFDQLGFKFDGKYYFDKCMPFGCSISCSTFEKFATFLEACVRRRAGSKSLLHYLDDFFGGGRCGSDQCKHLMQVFSQCMNQLGVPLADEKTVGPATVVCFLGLELHTVDSVEMLVRIPMEKMLHHIDRLLSKEKATLREIQSLIGVLNFACRAIIPGRPFCRRLINATCGLTKAHHHVRLKKEIRADLVMWKHFFKHFNGIAMFHDRFWVSNKDVELFTDSAAGHGLGFGIYFSGQWASAPWPESWHMKGYTSDITVLELFPILVAIHLWGAKLRNKKICFRSDNMAVVHIINSMTSKSEAVMVLVRNLTLKCLQFNISVKAQHISGSDDTICDALSRLQFQHFRTLAPKAEVEPQEVPEFLWSVFDKELLDC